MGKYPLSARLVLIGFRGAGKSTIAECLSDLLALDLVSTDAEIAARTGMPIAEYVSQMGWPAFRRLESEVIRSLSPDRPLIIDCGGGVVESSENMNYLRSNALVVWVDCDPETIYIRLAAAADRPLLSQQDLHSDILTHYHNRLPAYQHYSDLRVDTSSDVLEEICKTIVNEL